MRREVKKRVVKATELTTDDGNKWCPSCGEQIPEGSGIRHHMVLKSDGGHPGAVNVILVCESCHAKMHHDPSEGTLIRNRCFAYMLHRYGLKHLILYPGCKDIFGSQWDGSMSSSMVFHRMLKETFSLDMFLLCWRSK